MEFVSGFTLGFLRATVVMAGGVHAGVLMYPK